jgi:hypothetical protein
VVACFFIGYISALGLRALYWALAEVTAFLGTSPLHPKKTKLSDFEIGLALGIVGSSYILGSTVRQHIKAGKWRIVFMPEFIWPSKSAENPRGIARIGRVLHWTFVLFAASSLLLGIIIQIDSWQRHTESTEQARQWDIRHTLPPTPPANPGEPPKIQVTVSGYVGPPEPGDYRPYVSDDGLAPFLGGLFGSLVFLLLGRASRYILANE